ncbi:MULTISPECIES: TetR/AcrR family transcriptional regulator [Cupriavidus]|nr:MULTISPECIES: TetR/AcrR family transcriptional regulator [Cupriavidus]
MTKAMTKAPAAADGFAPLDGQAGFTPPRYSRGKRTADALLESGRQLLRTRTLDGMTVEELCAGAHVTTGAFYRRFDSKDAFFKALQALTIEASAAERGPVAGELDAGEWDLEEGIALIVRSMRSWYCRHEGVVRASQMQRGRDPQSWDAIRQLGRDYVDALVPRVMRLRGLPAPVRDEPGGLRIRFAFQLLFGALNNAVINNPGPLGLEDAAMETELARAVCAYLRAA